ncbi:MAG: signal peptidase I [Clostridia bacterium]
MKIFTRKRNLKNAITVICIILLAILVIILGNIMYAQINDQIPDFFGYSIINIISSSMEPAIPTNTFILIKEVDPSELEVGDIITFYSKDPMILGLPNTHRIKSIIIDGDILSFITKGDSNSISDEYAVGQNDIIGVYVKSVLTFGKFGSIFQNKAIIFVLLVIPAAVLFIIELINMVRTAKIVHKEKDKTEEKDISHEL